MTPDLIYEHLGLPDACLLDKRIYKRMVEDHGQVTAADKRMLSEDVAKLTWKYTLKASTVQVLPYEDDEREYLEIAVIEAELRSRGRSSRAAEVVQRAIPYPVLLVLTDGAGVCVNVAHKRFSLAEKGGIVAEGFLTTPWIDEPSAIDSAFFGALAPAELSKVDFWAMYRDMVAAVLARCCAEWTGEFVIDPSRTEDERRALLGQCSTVEREIASLRAAIRKEDRFAEKVELNTRIKELEGTLARTRAAL